MKKYWHIFALLLCALLAGCQGEPPVTETETAVPPATDTDTAEPEVLPTAVPPTALPPSPEPLPTDTPGTAVVPEPVANRIPTGGLFTLASDEPVIIHQDTPADPMKMALPGAVLFHDGQFHMFHNELEWWPSQVRVFYSTSPDGLTWTRAQEEPLFLGEELDVPYTAFVSSLLVEADGTWVLYFYTVDSPVMWGTMTGGSIGRATSPAPTGPWTADADFVLTAGDAGAWDDFCLQNPSVVRTADGYLMYYTGYAERQAAIGLATSADGIHWVKHEEPVFSRSGESGSWDNAFMIDPQVVQTPDGWVMLYARSNKVGQHGPYGFAVSTDGQTWLRSAEPVADGNSVGPNIWAANLLYQDDVYFVYVQSGRVAGSGGEISDTDHEADVNWNIFLLTHDGSLLP